MIGWISGARGERVVAVFTAADAELQNRRLAQRLYTICDIVVVDQPEQYRSA
jgi:hypothetical protein